MTDIYQLTKWCDNYLSVDEFKDYCPNGLQVDASYEGQQITKILTGVTACEALIDAAIEIGAQVILVHHGYFWRGEPLPLVGMKGRRVKKLMQNNISLLAYHLPIDSHQVVGNNAQLAKMLNLTNPTNLYPHEKHPIGNIYETTDNELNGEKLKSMLAKSLNRDITHVKGFRGTMSKIAICSGGAQGMIDQAALMGCHAYISGEISEPTAHSAREQNIDYFAAGHHATEIAGIKEFGKLINTELDINVEFIDIPNPA